MVNLTAGEAVQFYTASDGWAYIANLSGQVGFVPEVFLTGLPAAPEPPAPRQAATQTPQRRAIALYDYTPPPDFDGCISLVAGESVVVLNTVDDDWTNVETSSKKRGSVPTNYLQL